jgi:hypothetical protein
MQSSKIFKSIRSVLPRHWGVTPYVGNALDTTFAIDPFGVSASLGPRNDLPGGRYRQGGGTVKRLQFLAPFGANLICAAPISDAKVKLLVRNAVT